MASKSLTTLFKKFDIWVSTWLLRQSLFLQACPLRLYCIECQWHSQRYFIRWLYFLWKTNQHLRFYMQSDLSAKLHILTCQCTIYILYHIFCRNVIFNSKTYENSLISHHSRVVGFALIFYKEVMSNDCRIVYRDPYQIFFNDTPAHYRSKNEKGVKK